MRLLFIKLLYAICTPIIMLSMKILGVKTNGFCYSSGLAFIRRGRGSLMSFGKNVRMLNLSWMNSIGLNHRCIITTEKNAVLNIGENVGMSGVSIWCFKDINIENNVR